MVQKQPELKRIDGFLRFLNQPEINDMGGDEKNQNFSLMHSSVEVVNKWIL